MLAVFYSDDIVALNYEISKITSKFNHDQLKQIIFDDNQQNIIDMLLQTNLFIDDQSFLIRNASFLITNNKANEVLINSLKNINADVYMFLDAKFPKFLKDVDKSFVIKKITKFNDNHKQQLINDLLNKAKVKFDSNETQEKFVNIIAADPFLIENEINKLLMTSEHNIISARAVNDIVNNSAELNIFKLTNHLLQKDKDALIKLYDSLILNKYQPAELIPIIGNQLLTLKILKMAYLQNYSSTDIEYKLGITRYAQMVNKPLIANLSVNQINSLIDEFYLLDYNIKHNLVNPYQGLKLLLIK
jgi:DNA polymerase III delta subunit